MKVPFYNFHELHDEEFQTQALERIAKILEEGSFVEGPYNSKFQKEFAEHHKTKHCLLVANGTDALEISLEAAGIQPGDKVGVPGITFYATAEAVINRHAIPVLIDVNEGTGLMDPESLKRVLKEHDLKAIMPVHIYGLPAPIEELETICKDKNITIIEDAAQAFGTFLKDGPVGSNGNLTTFSFYPTKNLSACGDAGAILTDSDELAERIVQIRNHGRNSDGFGRNSRCDHMQAAILDLKLEKTMELNEKRKTIAKFYHENLKGLPLKLMPSEYLSRSSWHLYPVFLESKDKRVAASNELKEREIASVPFYEKALSQEPAMKNYEGEKEVSENLAGRALCLPIHPFLTEEDMSFVCKSLKEIL